jgi:3-keto-5-aminohexanoate cleavage enzyme
MALSKLVIEVKANEGAARDANPHVPFTPQEIGRDAAACREAGAALVHFHVRHADGSPDTSAEGTAEAISEVRAHSDILVLPAAANAPGETPAGRIANLLDTASDPTTRTDLLPVEMGAVNLDRYDPAQGRLLSEDRLLANDHAAIRFYLETALRLQIAPYLVSFNVSWTRSIEVALDLGLVEPPVAVGLILGGPGFVAAHPATTRGLDAHLAFLPDRADLTWIACAHGANALAIAAAAIERGGHVGIGLGDHPYRELGAPTNAELVAVVAELARAMGREVATADEARQILGCGDGAAR